jgi:serine/threonine protein phosphatase PrpC
MATCAMSYKIASFGLSDLGLVRKNNEDVWCARPDLNLFVIADGMGGHQAGEIAAREAVQRLCAIIESRFSPDGEKVDFHGMRKAFKLAVEEVNKEVYELGSSSKILSGMGTTLCTLYFHNKGIVYAHVGDSRIYRLRNAKLEQLTKDHSLFRELVDQGQMTEQEGADFPRNIITKAIGTEPEVEPSVHLSDVEEGDLYLMCTDGLQTCCPLESCKKFSIII